MNRTLTFSLLITITLCLLLMPLPPVGVAGASPATAPTAEELLDHLAARLNRIAQRYSKRGETDEAKIWRMWATFYSNAASAGANVDANEFLLAQIKGLRLLKAQASRAGYAKLAEQYSDLVDFWRDVYKQLDDDVSEVDISFPRSMLYVLPGAPATPWQGQVARSQPSVPRMCNEAEYNKCVAIANGMNTTMGAITRNECRFYISGC